MTNTALSLAGFCLFLVFWAIAALIMAAGVNEFDLGKTLLGFALLVAAAVSATVWVSIHLGAGV